jgi:hypothetical protein
MQYRCVRATALCIALSIGVLAQTPPAAPAEQPAATPAPAPAPPPAPVWSIGPIDFSGLIDIYADKNFNNPGSSTNGLRNFDVKSNQFSLSMAKLSLEHTADPVGFRADFGFGRAFEIIHAGEPKDAPSFMRNIEQAYISLKPPKGKGFQVDFGQFVTSAGAEVIETKDNWNYSRSLLFAWAIPYYHFGVRTSMPMGKVFTGGFQLVNGWNNVEDNNSGKTLGLTGNFAGKKISWMNTYYTGPENAGTNKGFRNLYDTTVLLTPADSFNAYVNFDYGANKGPGGEKSHWTGFAVAAKMSKGMFAMTPRIEYFNDANGFSTGTTQKLKEFTLTGEMKMKEGVLARLEYRHDWSNEGFFERGPTGSSKHQDTILIGMTAFFGPKR